jgi:predicted AAA+ superfamily ATPase
MKFGPYEVWEDVLDESFDSQVAPELGDVYTGEAPEIYRDPKEFFKRTYFTDATVEILKRILDTFEGKERRNIFLIYSLFGGGKTHLLLTLYHAFKTPEALEDPEVLEGYIPEKRETIRELAERIKLLGESVKVVPVYGKGRVGQPSIPLDVGPYSVKTIWGYIAHSLGKYSIVEKNDKNLTVPDIETLRDLFRGEKVLLLIDEIADYVDNLYNSGAEEDRRYAKNVDNFIDRLSTALSSSTSSMVITLPMTEEGGNLRTQEEYNHSVVRALWDAVRRVGGADSYTPVRTVGINDELVEVLKKRIFKRVDPDIRRRTLERIRSENNDVEIFGHGGFTHEIPRTYPFHPEYIQILRTIIEKTDLQRTRDMIRITRIVVRNLIDRYEKEGFAPAIILPIHIDLTNDRIRGMLFGEKSKFADYASIIDAELVNDEKYRAFRHPELARMILTYIFLRTYPFDAPTPLNDFPTLTTISRAIYDPETFSKKQWIPADIKDTVEEIESHPHFVFLNRKDGVFWFWRVANVTKMVDSKTEELIESSYGEIWNQLVRYVDQLVREKRSIAARGKGSTVEEHVRFFEQVIVSKEPQELMDNEMYKLFVLVSEDVDEKLLKGIMFQIGSGSRTYKNTVVVCYPIPGTMKHLIMTTARDMACQRVMDTVKEMYGKYGEDVVKIQLNQLRDIRNRALEDLENQIVGSFRKVAYPVKDGIDTADAPASSKSVVENVYSALKGRGKIVEEFDFIEFANWLKENIGLNILKPEGYYVSELRKIICSNPSAPMVDFENLKKSIKEAVRKLKIGLERKGKILFKKVYSEIPDFAQESGVEISKVEPDDIILPANEALRRQVCELLKQEKDEIRDGKRYRVWYEIYLPSSEFSELLKNLVTVENEECQIGDEEAVMYGLILEKKEEVEIKKGEFDLEVARRSVEGKPGEKVEIPFRITAFGDTEIELSSEYGELSYQNVFLREGESLEILWNMTIPSEKKVVKIEAKSEEKMIPKEIVLVPKVESSVLETNTLDETHKGMFLVSVKSIRDLDTLKSLPEDFEGVVSGRLETEKPEWKVQFSETDRKTFEYIASELEDFLGTKALLDVDFRLSEPQMINDLIFEKLRPLNGKVSFILKKGDQK